MYYLMGTAAEGTGADKAKAESALAKVDKFLSLTFCPFSGSDPQAGSTKEEIRATYKDIAKGFRDSDLNFMFGKDSDQQASAELICTTTLNEQYRAACVMGLTMAGDYMDSMSTAEMISEVSMVAEQKLLKQYNADYGKDDVYPTASDAFDFSKMGGVDVYAFLGVKDYSCPI